MKSRLMLRPCAFGRVPMPLIGPFCRPRLLTAIFSLPSALKIGVVRKTIDCSQSLCCPIANSRNRICADSLPSTSPAWMLPWMCTRSLPLAFTAAGLRPRPVPTTAIGIARFWEVVRKSCSGPAPARIGDRLHEGDDVSIGRVDLKPLASAVVLRRERPDRQCGRRGLRFRLLGAAARGETPPRRR